MLVGQTSPSKQYFKTGHLEVAIIGECLGYPQSPHYPEGNLIHDPSLPCLAPLIGFPTFSPILLGWEDQFVALLQFLPQQTNLGSVRTPGCSIAALQEDEGCGQEWLALRDDLSIAILGSSVPLVGHVSQGQEPDRVE